MRYINRLFTYFTYLLVQNLKKTIPRYQKAGYGPVLMHFQVVDPLNAAYGDNRLGSLFCNASDKTEANLAATTNVC